MKITASRIQSFESDQKIHGTRTALAIILKEMAGEARDGFPIAFNVNSIDGKEEYSVVTAIPL